MTKLEEFVKALEAINDFCNKREYCGGCPIHCYCVGVPDPELYQVTIRNVMECMKIIGSEEEG